MQQAALVEKGRVEVSGGHALPRPAAGEVLIRVRWVGICGSDIHYFQDGGVGDRRLQGPLVLGHEAGGVVEEVGEGVTSLRPGDRVAVEPGIPCLSCRHCLEGRYNLCPDVTFLGSLLGKHPVNGAMRQWIAHPALFTHRVPDGVPESLIPMAEPVAVAVHACIRSGSLLGRTVYVVGAGPMGMLTGLVARSRGAETVVIADVRPDRLALAERLGLQGELIEAGLPASREAYDVVFECSGSPKAGKTLRARTGPGSTVVLVGFPSAEFTGIDIVDFIRKEVVIQTAFRYVNTFPEAIRFLQREAERVQAFVSHTFPLEEAEAALRLAGSGEADVMKVMISL